jgi:rfaE bifunctional protein kinase chain/domain
LNSPQEIIDLVEKLGTAHFAVIGDVMVDSYIYGIHERMSPEAPVPVVDVGHREERLGGAANVALNLKALGAKVTVLSVVGDDDSGNRLIELLSEKDLNGSQLIQSKERKTTIKHRVIANDKHLLRVDEERIEDLSTADENALLKKLKEGLEQASFQAVIFQDYNKGVLTKRLIEEGIKLCNEYDVFCAVDPKKDHFLVYQKVSLFKPNLKEIIGGLNWQKPTSTEEELKSISQALQSRIGCDSLLLTLSERGVLFMQGNDLGILPAMPRNIVDVSGAGDTVLALASASLALGLDIETAAYLSNMAGGLVCEKVGVVPIDKEELIQTILNSN